MISEATLIVGKQDFIYCSEILDEKVSSIVLMTLRTGDKPSQFLRCFSRQAGKKENSGNFNFMGGKVFSIWRKKAEFQTDENWNSSIDLATGSAVNPPTVSPADFYLLSPIQMSPRRFSANICFVDSPLQKCVFNSGVWRWDWFFPFSPIFAHFHFISKGSQ